MTFKLPSSNYLGLDRFAWELIGFGLLVFAACAGLANSVEGAGVFLVAGIGVIAGVGSSLVSRRFGLLPGETVGLSLLVLVVSAVAVAGGPQAAARGLTGGWSLWLSSTAPALLTPALRVVPLGIGWLGASLAGALVDRSPSPLLPVVGPLASMALAILLSDSAGARWIGPVIILGSVVISGATRSVSNRLIDSGRSMAGGAAVAAAVLVAISVVTMAITPRLALVGSHNRYNLRQIQDRPWQALDEPSPLVTLKASLKESATDTEVLTVYSDTEIGRLKVAVLSDYSGSVWSVARSKGAGPSRFVPVDRAFPSPSSGQEVATFRIEVRSDGDVWLPLTGAPVRVEPSVPHDLYLNEETGTVAVPSGLEAGDSYLVTSVVGRDLSSGELSELTAATNPTVEDGGLDLVPPSMRNLAGDLFEGIDPGMDRAIALSNEFVSNGFYDHSEVARPGHSLARLDEFFADPNALVGYSEQYAAGAGVLGRIGGLPTRVVVGYKIPSDRYEDGSATVYAGDREAWIEVETLELGWVAIEVTPDRSREPEANIVGTRIDNVAIPNPPPPPAPPPEVQPLTQTAQSEVDAAEDEEESVKTDGFLVANAPVLVAGASVTAPLVLLSLAGVAAAVMKSRRRRKRRLTGTARSKVKGAWREMWDRLSEEGLTASSAATPSEVAEATVEALAIANWDEAFVAELADPIRQLAVAVDRATLGHRDPDEAVVDEAWDCYDRFADAMSRSTSPAKRLAIAADPRPLRRPL